MVGESRDEDSDAEDLTAIPSFSLTTRKRSRDHHWMEDRHSVLRCTKLCSILQLRSCGERQKYYPASLLFL